MTEKPVSITEFKCVDHASDALRRVGLAAQATSTRLLETLRHAAEDEDREAGYGVVEIVLLVVVVVLALVGIYYLAKSN